MSILKLAVGAVPASLFIVGLGLALVSVSYWRFNDQNGAAALLMRGVGFSLFPAGFVTLVIRVWLFQIQRQAIVKELSDILKAPREDIEKIARETRAISEFFALYGDATKLGIVRVFGRRHDFVPHQVEIFESGVDLFVVGITLRTLMEGVETLPSLERRLSASAPVQDFTLRILLYDPRLREVANLRDEIDGSPNVIKLMEAVIRLTEFKNKIPRNFAEKVRISLLQHIPYYFLVGNENKLFVAPYHFSHGREGPVYEVINDPRPERAADCLYSFYKMQFDTLWNSKSVPLDNTVERELRVLAAEALKLPPS